jgi:hypothetical protein
MRGSKTPSKAEKYTLETHGATPAPGQTLKFRFLSKEENRQFLTFNASGSAEPKAAVRSHNPIWWGLWDLNQLIRGFDAGHLAYPKRLYAATRLMH